MTLKDKDFPPFGGNSEDAEGSQKTLHENLAQFFGHSSKKLGQHCQNKNTGCR